jgi:hypothetical protein
MATGDPRRLGWWSGRVMKAAAPATVLTESPGVKVISLAAA